MNAAALKIEPEWDETPSMDVWNDNLAPKFFRFKHILVDGLIHHSDATLPSLPVHRGDRVLDVGCGFGDTALRFSDVVGPDGKVVGVDCCDAFLEFARREADAAGAGNVSFLRRDAEIELPENEFDFVFARFGTMFFADPVAGLRNMRKALRPGGRMVHIVWRARNDNPWLSIARDIVARFLPEAGRNALSCGPGPFAMADETEVRRMMQVAGYRDIRFKRVDAPVLVGNSVRDAIDFQLAVGPAGEVYRQAGEMGVAKREQIEAALAKAISRQKKRLDGIVMDSSSWVISAVNPAN